MKVYIEFTLPDNRLEHDMALRGRDFYHALCAVSDALDVATDLQDFKKEFDDIIKMRGIKIHLRYK